MDARTGRRQKRISRQQEQRVAKSLDGRTQAASGATRLGGGGDVRAPGMRVECKFTEKISYSLKLSDWEKVRNHAIKSLEQPIMQIGFCRMGRFDLYAVIQWVQGFDSRVPCELDGIQNQFSLGQSYLQSVLAKGERLRLTFRIDQYTVVRQLEVLHWQDFLDRRQQDAGD